jgi:hypothetical protein
MLCAAGWWAVACATKYVQPSLPREQMAVVQVESRARVVVDGRPVLGEEDQPPPEWFWVSAECHEILAEYEQSYVRSNGGVFIATFDPALFPLALLARSARMPPIFN